MPETECGTGSEEEAEPAAAVIVVWEREWSVKKVGAEDTRG